MYVRQQSLKVEEVPYCLNSTTWPKVVEDEHREVVSTIARYSHAQSSEHLSNLMSAYTYNDEFLVSLDHTTLGAKLSLPKNSIHIPIS